MIPSTLEQLQERFEIVEHEQLVPYWEYMWNTTIEEGREKKLKRQSFLRYPAIFPTSITVPDEIVVAECAVKVSSAMSHTFPQFHLKRRLQWGLLRSVMIPNMLQLY